MLLLCVAPPEQCQKMGVNKSKAQFQEVLRDGWVPDGERATCYHCSTQFSLTVRRHHCRVCGELFCGQCWGKKVVVPAELYPPDPSSPTAPPTLSQEPQSVCHVCYRILIEMPRSVWLGGAPVAVAELALKDESTGDGQPVRLYDDDGVPATDAVGRYRMRLDKWRPFSRTTRLIFVMEPLDAAGQTASPQTQLLGSPSVALSPEAAQLLGEDVSRVRGTDRHDGWLTVEEEGGTLVASSAPIEPALSRRGTSTSRKGGALARKLERHWAGGSGDQLSPSSTDKSLGVPPQPSVPTHSPRGELRTNELPDTWHMICSALFNVACVARPDNGAPPTEAGPRASVVDAANVLHMETRGEILRVTALVPPGAAAAVPMADDPAAGAARGPALGTSNTDQLSQAVQLAVELARSRSRVRVSQGTGQRKVFAKETRR